jgi:hypothetical protein
MAGGQTVPVGQAGEVETAGSLSIKIRTHMWLPWTRIAMKHEVMAQDVRRDAQRLPAGGNPSPLLQREADAALVCVCAAAFAIEAFYRRFLQQEFSLISKQDRDGWKKADTAGHKRVLETLRRGFDLRGVESRWRTELRWLFKLRGAAVHFTEDWKDPMPHPLGNNAAPELVAYSAESAERAINLLVDVLVVCRDKPKAKTQKWSEDMRGAIDELIGRRGQAG